MGLTFSQIEQELAALQSRREQIRQDAMPHLETWVRSEVEKCRLSDGSMTRDSVKQSSEMDHGLFNILRQALMLDCRGLAREANILMLRCCPDVPNLVRVTPVSMRRTSIRLMYKY